MKKIILSSMKFFWRLLHLIKYLFVRLLSIIFFFKKIDQKKIVVDSFFGKGFSDNPKYIIEELNKKYNLDDLDIVWLVREFSTSFPEYIRQVKFGSFAALKELSTAKVWIDNSRKNFVPIKRVGQKYLQTWHGTISLKKGEKDGRDNLSFYYEFIAKTDSKNCDLMIVGSDIQKEIVRKSFWYDGKILITGTPRVDCLINDGSVKETVKNRLGISSETIIILYAPTFRANSRVDLSHFPAKEIISIIKEKYKKDCEVLFRLHPIDASKNNDLKTEVGIDVSQYEDMQELLATCDFLITDYSSSMFDLLGTEKRCILFMYDYDNYISTNRGLYFDLNELPFPKALTDEELPLIFSNFDQTLYLEKNNLFMQKLGVHEDGRASQRVADIIMSWIKEDGL